MSQSTPDLAALLEDMSSPADCTTQTLDVRDLPPPEPLKETLERATELDETSVLVQLSDRVPQHLYPRLDDRGYAYDTVETDSLVVTAIWVPDTW